MREIKFRAWDKVLNKMITQENVKELLDKNNSKEWEIEFPYSSDEWYPAYQILGIFDYFNDIQNQGIKRYEPSENRFVLMQYTGLRDKNEKEIYEGDIIRKLVWDEHKYMETNNGQCYSYAQIQYIEELAGFYIVNCEGEICWELGQDKYNIEVIRKHI